MQTGCGPYMLALELHVALQPPSEGT
jgi:hypothetical protein